MNSFEKKYGIKEDATVKSFHMSRRMFFIVGEELFIADAGLPYSHAVWFEKEGWMSEQDDTFMDKNVRGIVDSAGDIYFYIGYGFDVNDEIEKVFFKHLKDLIKKLNLSDDAKIYGGLIKQKQGGKWPAEKHYGTIRSFL